VRLKVQLWDFRSFSPFYRIGLVARPQNDSRPSSQHRVMPEPRTQAISGEVG